MAQNLGQVKAVKVGLTPPTNQTMLWFDTNIGVPTEERPKVYDTVSLSWIPLSANPKYNTSLVDTLAMPNSVGGFSAGTTVADLQDRTFISLFDDLLFPTTEAQITSYESTILTDDLGSSTVEVGTSLNVTLTATFNRGQIQNGDGTSGPALVGYPNEFSFSGPGITGTLDVVSISPNLDESVEAGVTAGFSVPVAVLGNNIWNVAVSYDTGSGAYSDNKGNLGSNLDGDRVADVSLDSNPITSGRYYFFYGSGLPVDSVGVRGLTSSTFLSTSNTGTVTTTIGASDTEWTGALPAGKSVTIIDLDNLNADVTGDYIKSTFNVNDASGTPVSYDVYQLTLGVSYGSNTRHQFQIT